jgi:hypothetical protein
MPLPVRLFAFLILTMPVAALAQEEDAIPPIDYPMLPERAADAAGFAPPGWRVELSAPGDLDRDGRSDLAIVLRMNDPANVVPIDFCGETLDTNPRILAVVLAEEGGGYRLGLQNHELIPRRDNACAVDWFGTPESLAVERGTVRIALERFMSAGGWDMGTTSFTFRWEADDLRLIGYDYRNVRRNSGEVAGLSVNYLTGRAKLTQGRMDEDRETVRWVSLHSRRPIGIGSIGSGLDFDPEELVSSLP